MRLSRVCIVSILIGLWASAAWGATLTVPAPYADIPTALAAASPGDTIQVAAGAYNVPTTINVNKANLTIEGAGSASTIFNVTGTAPSGGGQVFRITAAGVTIQDLQINKTDKATQQLIQVETHNASIKNCLVKGQYVLPGEPEVARAMVVNAGVTGLLVDGCTFHSLRQPGYWSTGSVGTVNNTYVYGTRGWVIENADVTFTNNTWGTGANANLLDIAILSMTSPTLYTDLPALSAANGNARIQDQRVVSTARYVDDDGLCGGNMPCFTRIQWAIDDVPAGGTVKVYPGDYDETAKNRTLFNASGPYQFGLFIGAGKSGITIEGVDAGGNAITSAAAVDAYVTTNATNSFGYSGTFLEGDNVTITGLEFGPNNAGVNKTVELIGENATFKYCKFSDGGSLYINDWRVNNNGTPANFFDDIAHQTAYHIEGCEFTYSTSIDIASGAGASGPASGRKILNNSFDMDNQAWSAVSFNGAGSCVAWFTYTVGGAVITGNTFTNAGSQYIKARGSYDNTQFDWESYWNNNTYDRAVVALTTVTPFTLRDYTYSSSCFSTVRRIAAVIQNGFTDGDGTVAQDGDTILVKSGTYNEDVAVTKAVTLQGAGAGTTTILGKKGGDIAGVRISASNATIAGFTITRDGNNLTDWNDATLNSAGIAIQGLTLAGTVIRDNVISGNRTGIDINNSNGHTIRNNRIVDNRTGLLFRNQTDNLTVVENEIADNWTVGILFLDASSGSNSPVQTAANCSFFNNDISGNWYGQIVDRQSGGSLPAPGTNKKNFSGNWFGSTAPVISVANSAEPGYAAQIPVAYGGTAVAPGGQPDILGPASANFDVTPYLASGSDTDVETTLGRGTFGFQGGFSTLHVTAQLAQVGSTGRIQEGINLVTASTVLVGPGTFNESFYINKVNTKVIGSGAGVTIVDYTSQPIPPGAVNGGVYSDKNGVELRDLTVTRSVAGGVVPAVPRYGVKFDFAANMVVDGVTVTNAYRTGLDLHGVTSATVNNVNCSNNGGAGIFLTDVKGAALSNITTSGNPWVGVSVATSGQYTTLGTNGIVFSGTNSFGESTGRNGGLQLEMFKHPAGPPQLISWSSNPADGADVTIRLADFGYGLSAKTFDGVNVYKYVRFYQSLAQAESAAAATSPGPDHVDAGSRYIQEADDSNGLPNSGPTDLYVFDNAADTMSIQAAIDNASTAHTDTVKIGAGSYPGNVSGAPTSIILSPGASPAQVAIVGNVALDANDTLAIELDGLNPVTQFDNLLVTGTVDLGGATLSASLGFTPVTGNSFKIIDNDGIDPVVGTFAGLPEGTNFLIGGLQFTITYVGGDGNDVVLTDTQPGPATLELVYNKSCYKPGETVTATLRMKNLGAAAAGFQAFLHFDTTKLQFVSGAYTSPAPFGLPVITPITATGGGDIDVASGINVFGGQPPSSADADLVILTFTALGPDDCAASNTLAFRSHTPPTHVTNNVGAELLPLALLDAPTITIDGTAPLVTAGTLPNTCFANVAAAEAAALAATTASDNCTLVANLVKSAATVGTCSAVVTVTVTDCSGNSAFVQYNTRVDSTAPIITCPPSISVNADAGLCTASLNVGTPTASDNCGDPPTVIGQRSDNLAYSNEPAFSAPYPVGVTTITWVATDTSGCGNSASCQQTVTVSDQNELKVNVQLKGTFTGTLKRCVTFELWECMAAPGPTNPRIISQQLTFVNGLASNAVLTVPCGVYDCITARDKLHTLRRTDLDNFGVVGTQYVADFTDRTGVGGDDDSLVGGNLNDDAYIDILDFGVYVWQYALHYPGSPLPDSGDTTCSTPYPHADISGDGYVHTGDFSFIQINFLKLRDPNCCTGALRASGEMDQARSSVSVAQLKAEGQGNLAVSDLNLDGVVDQKDIADWLMGARPGKPLAPTPPRRR